MLPLVSKINFLISHHYQKKTVKEKKLVQISLCVFQKSKNVSMPLNLFSISLGSNDYNKTRMMQRKHGHQVAQGTVTSTLLRSSPKESHQQLLQRRRTEEMTALTGQLEGEPYLLPRSFQDIDCGSSWHHLLCFSEAKIPTKATPTMESWSRSSRRDRLVLWSQVYFRLMESWRFLRNDSRSRASLKNCGNTGKDWIVLNASAQWKVHKEGIFCAKLNQADYTLLDLWPPITKGPRVQTRGLKKAQCKILAMISSNTH